MHDPDFKYYKLDRDTVALDGKGGLVTLREVPRLRVAHGHILQAAMSLLSTKDPAGKQRWANAMLWSWYNWLPDYFFESPASATHKYHPAWADRPDGLLLHSLAVCRVAAALSELLEMSEGEYNELVFAAWHHDMFKYGAMDRYEDGNMTVHEHPLLAGEFWLLPEVQKTMQSFGIYPVECGHISDLVSTHAGPYRTSRFSDLKLPACEGSRNKLLYKADYIASRKEDGWVREQLVEMPVEPPAE